MIIIIVTFRNEVTYSCHLEIQKLKCSSKLSNFVHLSRISRRPRSLIGHFGDPCTYVLSEGVFKRNV